MIKKLIATLTNNRITTKTILIGTVLAAILGAAVLIGCNTNGESREGPENRGETTGQEVSERGGGESGGEHGSGGEGAETGGEEASAAHLAPNETFDMVRSGARLVMNYDPASNSFKGTVENTTNQVLTRMRIEVHLSNGTELGPTTPIDMAPGQTVPVTLQSTQAPFTGWIAHAEVGGGEGGQSGGEAGGEHGSGGEGRNGG